MYRYVWPRVKQKYLYYENTENEENQRSKRNFIH